MKVTRLRVRCEMYSGEVLEVDVEVPQVVSDPVSGLLVLDFSD